MSKKEKETQEVAAAKMRIRLLTPGGMVVSDRLVSQPIEFSKGPQEKHDGPFLIEFNLFGKEDAELAQEYLGKLALGLPLSSPKERKIAKKKIAMLDKEPIKELYHTAISKNTTQAELMNYLREQGFVFLTPQFIQDFKIPINIVEKHEEYKFMVRAVKVAKNPQADKYDHQLAFGFKLGGDSLNVQVYMYGEFFTKLKLEMGKPDKRTLQKPEFLVFPKYMTEEERVKFSIEHRKLKNDPELKPSKLYLRWQPHTKTK